ncbi:MAG TPA: DNA polymerase III subunit alpha [Nitriliruptorales bacterium]|nr:DNA polymerase III subunit alpha [Nitriliruptorales bacterium]
MVSSGARSDQARDGFVHLHAHTEYSMLDGASRVGDLVAAVAADGQPAVAITDHGVLFGAVEFARAAEQAGVRPILGMEAYQAPGSRFERGERRRGEEPYHHLTLLAADDDGYRNLIRLSTRAYLEGYWYKPRLDKELLAEHSEGIVALSGCLASEVNQALLRDDEAAARRSLGEFADLFGRDHFFVELMDHAIPEQRQVLPRLVALARDLGLRTVATNDSHYTGPDDWETHDVLLCIQTGAQIDDQDRLRFKGRDFYVKSAREMRELFRDHPEACDATLDIAEMCTATIRFGADLLPAFPCPDGLSEAEFLRRKVYEGAVRRYGDPLPQSVRGRLEHELAIIGQMGFPAYFLIVADLCDHARSEGIRVGPARGSAGGSAVAYCTGITQIDPLQHGLIFERFLNPERLSLPDIDIDFDERRRGDMIRYAAERYGHDRVAQIVTFATIKAKSAMRDAARVLGYPYKLGDDLCKAMPPAVLGREATLEEAFEKSRELREMYEQVPDARRVIDTARGLEGLRRQHGIHAAAVVIGATPLVETVPLLRTDNDGEVVTQYEMHGVEAIGLLKMDFLGLRNLTVMTDAERHIRDNRGEQVDVTRVPLDDERTYARLRQGSTLGVFQLESPGMQALVRLMEPDSFEDIVALNALYRPGPLGEGMHVEYCERKQGRKPVDYLHPDLEPILRDTYGIIVFQEQVLQMAVEIAGYTMGQADLLRKAMGKKIPEMMAAEHERFVAGAVGRGYDRRFAEELFALIETFAGYGFNKSHSVGYGVISYQTAWLKANYPTEYMAALLTSVKNNKDRLPQYLNECRVLGITVLPPDVNESDADFAPRGDHIRFGLSAVRNVGEAVVDEIVRARREKGRFTDFRDFCRKVDVTALNKRVVESLIKAGAFASLGHRRRGLLASFEPLLDAAVAEQRAAAAGQFSLFGDALEGAGDVALDDGVVISEEEFDKTQLLTLEREMLGLYVSDHPLFGAERALAGLTDHSLGALRDRLADDGRLPESVTVGGVLMGLAKRFTRKGEAYLAGTLEDLSGAVETIFFPSVYREHHDLLVEDRVVVVRARVDARDENLKLVVVAAFEPDLSEVRGTPLVVRLDVRQCTRTVVDELREILARHPGHVPVHLALAGDDRQTVYKLGDGFRVTRRPGLFGELRSRFGPEVVGELATAAT